MKVELERGEGVSLLSNHINDDWTRFYLSFEDVLLPLGAGSLNHVGEWLHKKLWQWQKGTEANFFLNFNDPHATLSVTRGEEAFTVDVWDKDGVLLFHREIREVHPLLKS